MRKTQIVSGIRNTLKAITFTDPDKFIRGISSSMMSRMGYPPDNKAEFLEAYKYWVYAGVSAIARNEAKVPLNLFYKKGTGEEWEEVHDHPYIELMKNPNPELSLFEMRELRTLHLSLTGDAYWYLVMNKSFGKPLPVEVYPLLPDRVRIIGGGREKGIIGGYKYRMQNNEEIEFSPEEIVHFRLPNPSDLYFYGYAPLKAMVYTVNLDETMRQFMWEIFKNGAIPGTVLSTEKSLGDDTRNRIYEEWEKFEGVKNVASTVLLDGGLKAERLGFSLQELSFPEGSKRMMDEVLAVLGTPKTKLGIGDTVNRATAFELEKTFQAETIHPILLRNASKENQKIITLYDPRLEMEYENPVPQDRELELKEWDMWLRNYVFSVDEYRDYLGAETPSGWGEKPLAGMNIFPLETGGNTGQNGGKSSFFFQAGQKEKKGNTVYQERKLRNKRRADDAISAKFRRALTGHFKKEHRQVIANLQRLGLKSTQKVNKDVMDFLLLPVEKEAQELTKVSVPFIMEGLKYGISIAGDEVGIDTKKGFAGERGEKTEFVNRVDMDLGIYNDYAVQYVNDYHFRLSYPITEETQRQLREGIEVAIREGETMPELSDRIGRIFDFSEQYRSDRIARTETARSVCQGELKIYEDAGIETKHWLTADAEVCDDCIELSGKEVAIRENFPETSHFDGVPAPPLHPNCRCDVIAGEFAVKDEERTEAEH